MSCSGASTMITTPDPGRSLGARRRLPAAAATSARANLAAYEAKRDATSVSGISSGAYMAGQFEMAHSKDVVGAAIIAGGPYGCSESLYADIIPGPGTALLNLTKAINGCMLNALQAFGVPDPAQLAERADAAGRARPHRSHRRREDRPHLPLHRHQRSHGRPPHRRCGAPLLRRSRRAAPIISSTSPTSPPGMRSSPTTGAPSAITPASRTSSTATTIRPARCCGRSTARSTSRPSRPPGASRCSTRRASPRTSPTMG